MKTCCCGLPAWNLRHRSACGPENTYFGLQRDFYMNDEAVILYHMLAAHTDGDSIVFFRKSDVVSTGDVFTPDRFPVIDIA